MSELIDIEYVRVERAPGDGLLATCRALKGSQDFYVPIRNERGMLCAGHLRGVMLLRERGVVVFVTKDSRLLVHDRDREDCVEIIDPPEELLSWLSADGYVQVMHAVGDMPLIEL